MKLRPRALLVAACALLAGLVAAAFAACLPAYTFGEGGGTDSGPDATSGGDAASDATPGADAPAEATTASDGGGTDAPADAPPRVTYDAGPPLDAQSTFAVVGAGTNAFSTGYGYQLHVVFAENDGRYWLFYASDTTGAIQTLVSPDLVNWTAGAPISLTSGYAIADGYAFSVAYANIAGHDVVHIVENSVSGSSYASFHIRAEIAGGAITASTPVIHPDTQTSGSQGSSGPACPNDGPAAAIAGDGHAWDVTAWTGHPSTTCDTNIYLSPGVDTGSAWNTGAFAHDGYYVSLPTYTFCHELVTLPEAGVEMILYPDWDNAGTYVFDTVGWALSPSFSGGGPGTTGVSETEASELFNGSGDQASIDDWAACRLADDDIHVLRHVLTIPGDAGDPYVGPFQELMYDGTNWNTVAAPPAVTSATSSGLVVLSSTNPGAGMLAAVIGTDNAIHIARNTGSGWAQLASIPGATTRQSLAGTGCGSVRPAIFWTEGAGAPYQIMVADLSGLL